MNKHSKLITVLIFVTYHFGFVFCQFYSKPRMIDRPRRSGTWYESLQLPTLSIGMVAEEEDLLVNPDGQRAQQVEMEPRAGNNHRLSKDFQSKPNKMAVDNKPSLCAEKCQTPKCSVSCKGATGLAACKARQCEATTIGADSASLCAGSHCKSQCRKMDCMATCEGPNCSAKCSGKSCITAVKGSDALAMCNNKHCVSSITGPRTVAQCKGQSCKATCAGHNCVAKCNGIKCVAACQGTSCVASCAGSDCKFLAVNGAQHIGAQGVSTENLALSLESVKNNKTNDKNGEIKTKGVIAISGLRNRDEDNNIGDTDVNPVDTSRIRYNLAVQLNEKLEEYLTKKMNQYNDFSLLSYIPKLIG